MRSPDQHLAHAFFTFALGAVGVEVGPRAEAGPDDTRESMVEGAE